MLKIKSLSAILSIAFLSSVAFAADIEVWCGGNHCVIMQYSNFHKTYLCLLKDTSGATPLFKWEGFTTYSKDQIINTLKNSQEIIANYTSKDMAGNCWKVDKPT